MAFDGLLLHKVLGEVRELIGGRIDKLSQPASDSLVITFRANGKNKKLLISVEGNNSRIQITSFSFENPPSPPMFTMLLRKHLMNAKLIDVVQCGADRTVELVFATTNELGDDVQPRIVCELMGRRSNIILLDSNRKIIDTIYRVDPATNPDRPILPKIDYSLPTRQDKFNTLLATDENVLLDEVLKRTGMLSKAILGSLEGFSPLLSRELAMSLGNGEDVAVSEIDDIKKLELRRIFRDFLESLNSDCKYTAVYDETGKLIEFSFVDINQYGTNVVKKHFETAAELLDEVYGNTNQASSLRQRAENLHKTLKIIKERIIRKISRQQVELAHSLDREDKKKFGDLISANIYRIEAGAETVELEDFYSEDMRKIVIPLNVRLSASQNAQKYYSEYKKLLMAEKMLTELIAKGEDELKYIEEVMSALDRAENVADIVAIREELVAEGILKNTGTSKKQQKTPKLAPKQYISTDGYTILCGRNSSQNDALTTKLATNYDMWCHVQNSPGSHAILVSKGVGDSFPNRAIEEACVIAACNSQNAKDTKVAVDYTPIRYVKKPRGARPGMVIYTEYSTAYVVPDFELEKKLRSK